jgi:hypothetical protein
MKKIAITALAVLALAASANAQGTWYTDQALWLSRTTVTNTANYNSIPSGFFTSPYTENGVNSYASGGFYGLPGALSTNSQVPITFNFSGNNAFGGILLSHVDEIAAFFASEICDTPFMVTRSLAADFLKPMKVGNVIKTYCGIEHNPLLPPLKAKIFPLALL